MKQSHFNHLFPRRLVVIMLAIIGSLNSLYYLFFQKKADSYYLSILSPIAVVFVQPTFFDTKKLNIKYKSGVEIQARYSFGENLPVDRNLYMLMMFNGSMTDKLNQQIVDYLFCNKSLRFKDWLKEDVVSIEIIAADLLSGNVQSRRTWECP